LVLAHIRHAETGYDELLLSGLDRWEARERVEGKVFDVEYRWKGMEEDDAGEGKG